MSKAQKISHNIERPCAFHDFDVGQDILIGNGVPIGTVSIEQAFKGVKYPNAQDAIKDLASLYELPINTVITNTDGVEPIGISQVDSIKFSGAVAVNLPTGTPVNINVYGFIVEAFAGETADEFAVRAKVVLETAAFNNLVFAQVSAPTASQVLVRYLDQKPHILPTYTNQGIKIEQIIQSPARPGYGTWTKIGTSVLKLNGQPDTTVFHFKRIN